MKEKQMKDNSIDGFKASLIVTGITYVLAHNEMEGVALALLAYLAGLIGYFFTLD